MTIDCCQVIEVRCWSDTAALDIGAARNSVFFQFYLCAVVHSNCLPVFSISPVETAFIRKKFIIS